MKEILKKYYPHILIALSLIILIYRAFLGFCFSDETFYYSISYRLLSGDSPFFTEWYPTQLNSILLLPIAGLYNLCFGSTGVILFFRILYVIVSVFCAVFLYKVVSFGHHKFTATICSLLLMFYVHLSIPTFSYYAVSVLGAVMMCSLIVHYFDLFILGTDSKKYLIFSGIFTAIFVLSMPTMAVSYIVTVLIILLLCLLRKIKPDFNFNTKKVLTALLYNLYGILIIAVPFFIYLFSSVSIKDFISSIPYVLTDEEHITTTLYVTFKTFVTNVTDGYFPYFYIVCLLAALAVIIRILRYKKGESRLLTGFETIVVLIDFLAMVGISVISFSYTGYIQSVMIIGVVPILILSSKPSHRLIFTFLYTGVLMAFCYTFTSSGSPLYTEVIGLFVMGFGAICLFEEYITDIKTRDEAFNLTLRKITSVCFCTMLVIILSITMFQRMNTIYRDDKVSNLTARITYGPGAGIMTSKEHLEMYNSFMDTLNDYCMLKDYPDGNHQNLLISKLAPFGYMVSDMKCASFSSWRSKLDSERLPLYYSVHPERFPDVVLILNDDIGSYETSWDILGDPIPNSNELKGEFFEYIDSNYTKKSVPCGTLYVK